MSCLCLRIGWVVADDVPPNLVAITQWCSQRDIVQLVERCMDAPDDLRYDIFSGSRTTRTCGSTSSTRGRCWGMSQRIARRIHCGASRP